VHYKTRHNTNDKKLKSNFEPSMITLSRILKTMVNDGPKTKTSLSVDANVHYTRLTKHIVWMEKKGLVESTIDESRVNVGLTDKGKIFASTFSNVKYNIVRKTDKFVADPDTNVSAA
jgi:predicted transcriptional regulator